MENNIFTGSNLGMDVLERCYSVYHHYSSSTRGDPLYNVKCKQERHLESWEPKEEPMFELQDPEGVLSLYEKDHETLCSEAMSRCLRKGIIVGEEQMSQNRRDNAKQEPIPCLTMEETRRLKDADTLIKAWQLERDRPRRN